MSNGFTGVVNSFLVCFLIGSRLLNGFLQQKKMVVFVLSFFPKVSHVFFFPRFRRGPFCFQCFFVYIFIYIYIFIIYIFFLFNGFIMFFISLFT